MISPVVHRLHVFGRNWLAAGLLCLAAASSRAEIIWSDLGTTLAHETGPGQDILNGALKRDESASDTLYFKFHVNPISDAGTEPYFAAFELYEGDSERLAVGNALRAWAYGAFNVAEVIKTNFNVFEPATTSNAPVEYGMDLNSSKPTIRAPYELPRKGIERTIVFKVQYQPGGKDQITVWLDPDLGPGATERNQLETLTTHFRADASFNQIRLRHGGGGDGWTFSEMAIATSFSDFVLDERGTAGANAGLAIGREEFPFTFRLWQREQGLPQNYVRALAQTRDGYIWVGSDAGISRFDGIKFTPIGLQEGFQAGPVQTMLGDREGLLWIGTAGHGLARWLNGAFATFTRQNGLPSDSVNALAEDDRGALWVGTDGGLAVLNNGNVETPPAIGALAGKTITSLFHGRGGTMWIGAKGMGVFCLRGNSLTQLHSPNFDSLLEDPHCLLVDNEGRVWVGAGDDSILCREGEEWRQHRFPRHVSRHYVTALAEDTEGTVWAGSASAGLFQFKHGKLMAVNASSGLADNLVETLLVDREGKLWVGTHGGLNRLRPKNLSVIGYNEGLGHGAVLGLTEVTPGIVWASKSSEGLFRWDGRYFNPLATVGLSAVDEGGGPLLTDKDGSCWMGGPRGLLRFGDARSIETNSPVLVLAVQEISAVVQNAQGALWVGTRRGDLWRQNNGQWHALTNGQAGGAITAILPQQGGLLWVGTAGNGLFLIDARANSPWIKQGGLLSDWVRTLYADADGTIWVGTGGGGLSRLKDGQIVTFTTRNGLPDNTISQILDDDAGNLWLGGDRGLVCVNKRELDEVAAHKIQAVDPRVYGRAEGMLSEECISGFFPLGLKTKAGLLWFPTQEGIVVVDPNHQTVDTNALTVVLEETLIDGVPSAASSLHLSPGKHWLEFHYTGLNFDAPERVRFRYRLAGLNSDWVDAGSSRSASFPYVPYGRYQFEVVAGNGAGEWNKTGASVSLIIDPYIWQTWWFRVPAALALLAAIAVGVRFLAQRKLQRQLEQLEQERVLAQERERIARDLHDDLGSSLARISLLSGLLKADRDNPGQVENHAVKISQSADQTVRALEEIVWAVRPGSDSLQSLVEYIAHFANELFEGGEIRCRLDLPHDLPARPLPPDMRHNIFLVVKEALTNALKHAGAREVRLRAVATAETLEIVVEDNGRGFEMDHQKRGNGLGNIRRRAQAMGENVTIESAPGRGTVVKLKVHFPTQHSNGKAAA